MKEELSALIYKALHKASTCWTITPMIGSFDARRAESIAEHLVLDIKKLYPSIEQEEVPERDTHFEGFALLIFREIQEMAISYNQFPGVLALREHECKIITQRLWDFAWYTRKYFRDGYEIDEIPDRTTWPDKEEAFTTS